MALYSTLQKFITKEGSPVEGASVNVKLSGGAVDAELFATRTGAVKSNPFLTTANGEALCYVKSGRYDMTVTKGTDQIVFKDIEVGPVSNVGTFAEGGTITDPDQLVEDAVGNKWRWTGNLNYIYAAGENPENTAEWVKYIGGKHSPEIALLEQWGYNYKGTFAKGFTYSQEKDAGIDAGGNSWIYIGAGAPNKVVTAGTVPSVGAGYEQVTFNAASGVLDSRGTNVQDYINKTAIPFSSVQEMKSQASTLLSVGDKVSTGSTIWRVVTGGGKGLQVGSLGLIPLNGAWINDWGVDLGGQVGCDTELEEAISLNGCIKLPVGVIRVNTMKSVGTNTRIRGQGPDSTIDARMSDVLFNFPTQTGRSVKAWSDFFIISTGSTMQNGVAFKIGGTPLGQQLQYSSGWKFENIEVGGGGEFGCIWDISDTFRFTARDCGYTSVTNPVRIRGSVVQCTIDNVTGNNTDYTRSYDSQNCGVYMEIKNSYSDGVIRVPENVKIMNCGFVVHRRGINATGLAITSENNDLDFIRDVGIEYYGGNGHLYSGGYVAPGSADHSFVGVRVTKASSMEPVSVKGIMFNAYNIPNTGKTYTAIQIGSGDASPYAETNGVTVDNNRVYGRAKSWDFGIQADRNGQLTITNNKIANGVIKDGGKAINLSNQKCITATGNIANGQELYISAPDTSAVGTVTGNQANVVKQFIAGTLEIARNKA